jgi:hypothetical protein
MAGNYAQGNGGNTQKFVPWPDWEIRDVPSLAQYVSVPALDETGLRVTDRFTKSDPTGTTGHAIASAVYESLRELGLKYMHDPWREQGFRGEFRQRQRVRYPARIRRDSGGTCLDLAILYAAALMRAQIRPYIAIFYRTRFSAPVHGDNAGHAFVVADLITPLTAQDTERIPPRPLEVVGTPLGGLLRIRAGQDLPPYLLAVDPTHATTNFPLANGAISEQAQDFAEAEASAREYLRFANVRLCDVATAQAMEHHALGRPADDATPAIWTRLPEMPPVSDYPSRAPARKKLAQEHERIVIYGPRGFGKSTLAYLRARDADSGYGWFLNAADRSALQSELARAENDQQVRGYRQPLEQIDRVPFSVAAVRRLEVSDAPWVLVLDNADANPGDIESLLPTPGPNQTIIVTTTNPQWLEAWGESQEWPRTTHVILEPLDNSTDMAGIDDIKLRTRVGGSPLFYEAARTAINSGAHVPSVPGSAAGLVWQLARDYLDREPGAVDLAQLIAWAPPVAMPVAEFAEFFDDTRGGGGDPVRLARLLERAGLIRILTRPAASVLMHRLIAERIRQDQRLTQAADHGDVPTPVALLATTAGQDLMTRLGDDESFTRVEEFLDHEPPASVPLRAWGLATYGVARAGEIRGRSEQSSRLFAKVIDYPDETVDRSLLSECWNGRARYLKDHPPADRRARPAALADALSWAGTARQLATEAANHDASGSVPQLWDLIRAERAHAMQALIMRKQADGIADREQKKAQLAEALDMLIESEANRTGYLKALGIHDNPDMDRARFNIGGSGIGLAKLSRGQEAEKYLRIASDAYEEAKRIRVQRHGEGVALPAIASCDNGIALSHYYAAVLGVDPSRDERLEFSPISRQKRMDLLRRANAACAIAFSDRTILAPANRDDGDAIKSDDLMIKICQMRKLISALHGRGGRPLGLREAMEMLGTVESETLEEAHDLGGIFDPATDGPGQAASG